MYWENLKREKELSERLNLHRYLKYTCLLDLVAKLKDRSGALETEIAQKKKKKKKDFWRTGEKSVCKQAE